MSVADVLTGTARGSRRMIVSCAGHIAEDEGLSYLQWHHRAARSHSRGERQKLCPGCDRWFWPWEMKQGPIEQRRMAEAAE